MASLVGDACFYCITLITSTLFLTFAMLLGGMAFYYLRRPGKL